MRNNSQHQTLPTSAHCTGHYVWHAEPIQPTDEKTTRRIKLPTIKLEQIPDLKRVGTLRTPEGRILPWYSMDGFLNTTEGWQLYCECRETGDMRPYQSAKAAWNLQREEVTA